MISGFKDGDRNSNADDRKRALHLASSYAPDSFVSRKEVGAALDYAIARVAREYKANVGKNAVSNSVNFSLGDGGITLEIEMAAWEKQLSEYLDGNKRENRDMRVCTTPSVLRMVGAKPHDIVITPSVLSKVKSGKHMVSREALEQIPSAISDPICIAKSDTQGSIEIITDLQENGHNILVAVQLDTGATASDKIKVNRITSLYGKENIGKLLTHPMLYWNKAKARPWGSSSKSVDGTSKDRIRRNKKGTKSHEHSK